MQEFNASTAFSKKDLVGRAIEALGDVLVKIQLRFRPLVREDVFRKASIFTERVLVYYKTDPLQSRRLVKNFRHTNNSEILAMITELDSLGFVVDLVDREASTGSFYKLSKNSYDLAISNCAGNSAPLHSKIREVIRPRALVAYAMGPDPLLSVRNNIRRHNSFESRTGSRPILRRMVEGKPPEWDSRFKHSDAIFVNGKAGTFCFESYKRHGAPIYTIPSILPEWLQPCELDFESKSTRHFIYFGGNGLICKGLDIVLEAFDGLMSCELDICAPSNEQDFLSHYSELLARNPNIRFHGFIDIGSPLFRKLTKRASFNLFPASSECAATSVLVTMRAGVIPVVTPEAGINVEDFGFFLETELDAPQKVRDKILEVQQLPLERVRQLSIKSYRASLEYNSAGFRESFRQAIIRVMENVGEEK